MDLVTISQPADTRDSIIKDLGDKYHDVDQNLKSCNSPCSLSEGTCCI